MDTAQKEQQQRATERRVSYAKDVRRAHRRQDSQQSHSSSDDGRSLVPPPPLATRPGKKAPTTRLPAAATARGKAIVPPKVSLQRHRSRLPTFLYLLSFCPKVPSLFTSPKAFFQHPGVLYFLGLLSAILSGLCVPALDLIYGKVWTKDIIRVDATRDSIRSTSNRAAWYVAVIAIAYLTFSWTFLICFTNAAQVLSVSLRHGYVESSLCQDSAWHEEHGAGEIAATAGKEISAIRVAFGEKLAFVLWSCSTLLASLIIGFTQGAKIAAVLWTLVPFTLVIFAFLAVATDKVVAPLMKLEGKANSFIEEAFGGVRVTQAFAMRERIVTKFEETMLAPILKLAVKRGALRAAETGLFYFSLTVSYSFAFWIIAHLQGPTGSSMTIFWGVLNGLFALLNVVPMLTNIQDAVSALDHIRCVIEREPLIDIRNTGGAVPRVDATAFNSPSVRFDAVTMAYPSRPNVASLDNVSVSIPSGQVTALVGPSGSGKSTLTELIIRAYDPLTANVPHPVDAEEARLAKKHEEKERRKSGKKKAAKRKSVDVELSDLSSPSIEQLFEHAEPEKDREFTMPVQGSGTVTYAGRDVREINLVWLRSQIAVVRQSPQIFTGSIFENTAAGLIGTEWELRSAPITAKEQKRNAKIRQKVKVALKKAQAWDFVSRLPEGMDTCINGGKTGLLSGGQRQRIAIARALVGEPKLLIIDEGTSALDSSTEAAIRDMLAEEQRKRGMTVILVAHRLSTIQHADQIVVMRAGCVVDRGVTRPKTSAYAALMRPGRGDSTFRNMVNSQQALASGPVLAPTLEEDAQSVHSGDSHEFSDDATTQVASTSTALAPPQGWSIDRPTSSGLGQSMAGGSPLPRSGFSGRPMSPSVPQFPNLRRQLSSRQSHHYGISARGGGIQSRASEYRDIEYGEEKEEAGVDRGYTLKFLKLLRDYKWLFITGLIGSLAVGASFPVSGYLVGEVVESLAETDNSERVRQTNRWSLWFLVLAIADLLLILTTSTSLEVASEKLIARLKVDGMRSLLQQEIGFFDSPDSQPGTIAANLASFPQNVGSATGLITAQILVSSGNLVGSFILALVLSWKAALVVFSPVIILFFSGWANVVMLERYESVVSGPAGDAAGQLAEAMDAYHEVITLGREQEIMRQMDERSRAQPKRASYLVWGAGGFAVSQAMILGVASLVFFFGGELYARSEISIKDLYTVFECAIIAVFAASRLLTFSPDIGRAAAGFKSITRWIDRKPIVATLIPANGLIPFEGQDFTGEGDIVFRNVEMRYPQRPDHSALKGLDLVIKHRQTHAFCGVSGGGKSSILQLCARFYDPYSGTIQIGSADVRKIPLEDYRASISIVTQEATLLSGTIRWNIALGARSPETVTQREIEEACEQACILDFIRGLPHGFETDIGSKGAQLSGGQKQRICIARAIVRQPRILLLDEATSALDAQSEASVQRALDRAARGRTTITIAHRLSTIRHADVIHVVEDGKIVESGSHAALLAAGGRYLELIQAQL